MIVDGIEIVGGLEAARECAPLAISVPFRGSRTPELAANTALTIELRAEVAFCTTVVKSLVGSAKAFSISIIAALALARAGSVFGKPTAFARYSPISAERLVNFLRFSSCCLAVTSEDAIATAVASIRLVVTEVD